MIRQALIFIAVSVAVVSAGVWVGARGRRPGLADSLNTPSCPRFEEAHEAAGVRFHHFDSPRASLLPEDVGSGAGWGDFDNDGDEDLYLVNCAGPFLMEPAELAKRPGNRLFRNDGGKFTDVTAEIGVGHVGWDYACLWIDVDNDGWLDLLLTHYDGVVLYRNRDGKKLIEATADAGLADIRRFLLGATAADYDHDGDLDIYLCGYVTFDREKAKGRPLVAGRPAVWTNPTSYPAEPNILLQNDGRGVFTDVTETAGVANPDGKSMQGVFCDFDNDAWADLYVANDVGTADVLFHNRRDGTFAEVSLEAGTYDRRASMGLTVGDVWRRGWMDLFATHWVAEDHALWKNRTDEFGDKTAITFDDVAPAAGIVAIKKPAYVGWGAGLYDFDNDGHLDLMLVNGSTIEDELTLDVLTNPKLMPQPAQLLHNDGTGKFIDVSDTAGAFFAKRKVSRGLAFADYDHDGRMDAVVVTHGEPATLLHNATSPRRCRDSLEVGLLPHADLAVEIEVSFESVPDRWRDVGRLDASQVCLDATINLRVDRLPFSLGRSVRHGRHEVGCGEDYRSWFDGRPAPRAGLLQCLKLPAQLFDGLLHLAKMSFEFDNPSGECCGVLALRINRCGRFVAVHRSGECQRETSDEQRAVGSPENSRHLALFEGLPPTGSRVHGIDLSAVSVANDLPNVATSRLRPLA